MTKIDVPTREQVIRVHNAVAISCIIYRDRGHIALAEEANSAWRAVRQAVMSMIDG